MLVNFLGFAFWCGVGIIWLCVAVYGWIVVYAVVLRFVVVLSFCRFVPDFRGL